MTTYNTGNPLGSSAAKDLYDNAQNLDFAVNSITQSIWLDRFGRARKTWFGIEKTALEAISAFGYVTMDSFEDGATVTLPNQILRWKSNGEYYRWDGEFPKTVASGSTPDTTGGIGNGKWLSVGAAALASPQDGAGDALIAVKQPGSGASVRTQHEKNAEVRSILDYGGVANDSSADNSQALIDAALAVGEGGTVRMPTGVYRFVGASNITSVNIVGDGQGSTILEFDNTLSANDGIIFNKPTKRNIERGARHLTIKTVGGNGRYCFDTVGTGGFNQLYPKCTFQNISFCSEDTGDVTENFSQTYSWSFMFHLGDSWQLIIDGVDAVGCYKTTVNPSLQFLDGFIRFNANQGILSSRISNITTHNIANCVEIRQKSYFSLHNIDFAKAYQGVYDAPDRVFETNPYAYGESIWTNVIINAQKVGVKLKYRFDLMCAGLIIHKGTAFDNGTEWVGLDLERARVTRINGLEIGSQSGYSGKKIGLRIDGGDDNAFTGVSFGTLDVGAQIGIAGSANGAAQAVQINNSSINAAVTSVFDIQMARNLIISGYANSSVYSYTNFALFGADTSNTYTFSNINHAHEWTDDSIYWRNGSASTDTKSTRISLLTGLTIASQTDTGSIGNNVLIGRRTGITWDSFELRTKSTSGGYILLTSPEIQFSGLGKPTQDNVSSWGTQNFRWTTGYFASGVSTTSDRNYKEQEKDIDEKERAAAIVCKSLLKKYKYKDAVIKKGDAARWHFGAIAQDVVQAFVDQGLSSDDYGIVVYDEWEEVQEVIEPAVYEDGVLVKEEYVVTPYRAAGSAYSLRYEELLCFIMSSI